MSTNVVPLLAPETAEKTCDRALSKFDLAALEAGATRWQYRMLVPRRPGLRHIVGLLSSEQMTCLHAWTSSFGMCYEKMKEGRNDGK